MHTNIKLEMDLYVSYLFYIKQSQESYTESICYHLIYCKKCLYWGLLSPQISYFYNFYSIPVYGWPKLLFQFLIIGHYDLFWNFYYFSSTTVMVFIQTSLNVSSQDEYILHVEFIAILSSKN